jgi:hypothetical protein
MLMQREPFMFRAKLLLVAAAAAIVAVPASAVTTFATFSGLGDNIRLQKDGANDATLFTISTTTPTSSAQAIVPDSVDVTFSFVNTPLSALGSLTASFTMNVAVTQAANSLGGGFYTQNTGAGTFSFLSTAPINWGGNTYAAGSNLLSGSFCTATLFGASSSGSLSGSTDTCAFLTFTSDFLNFTNTTARDFSMSLTAITPILNALSGETLSSFNAFGSGNFSAEPLPTGVPEPATWAMLVLGMGMVGAVRRRRREGALV